MAVRPILKGANQPAMLLALLFGAAGAGLIWLNLSNPTPFYFPLGVVLIVVALLIPRSLMMADQWERAVVLRLGKLNAVRGPGLFLILPFIDQITSWLDQRIQ